MDCNLSVTKSKRSMVKSCEETPWTTLHLSHIDNLPVLRCNARTLHVFRDLPPDAAPAAVIKQALSTALVPYYPLAGRLSGHHPLRLNCSNQGVLFVEASSAATLASLNYFHDLTAIPFHLLLPDPEPEPEPEPLVQIQVTQFAGGGFVMGLVFCHSICDGLGAAQFLNDVGKLARARARAIDAPTIAPTWNRDFFPPIGSELKLPTGPPVMPDYILQHANIDIPIDCINRLKTQFRESTGTACSVFDIAAACFWRSRTRAVYAADNGEDEEIRLVFFANCRKFVDTPLPEGFYGNCFFPVRISGWSRGIGEASVNDLVKLIQEAKGRVGREFREYKSQVDGGEEENDPFAPPLKYSTLFISEWGKLGFNEVDYGYGPPAHVVPIQGSAVIPVGIVGSLPSPEKGVRLMTWCVQDRHRPSFLHQISQLL